MNAMTDRSPDENRPPGPRIWLEGEKYHIREVPGLYRPHPEGLPGIARNCLLIGYPGVGKTMILKKLCADLATDDTVFPLYVQIEPWAAKVSGEITYPIERRQAPWDRQLLTCFRILPSLGIIDRVHKYGTVEVVKAGTDLFPHRPVSPTNIPQWINEQVQVVRRVLEQGDSLPPEYEGFPSLFEVANAIGGVARDQDKTLVLLVDQVDKTSAAHFGALTSLLRRGHFVVVVATRPCPGAPEAAAMPSAVVPGNDYGIHWVGCDARSHAWRQFISAVIQDQRFNQNVSDLVLRHLQPLTSLVGPSVRTLISLYLDLERRITTGISQKQAWNEALTFLMEGSEGVAAELLAAWCNTPMRVIKLLRDRTVKARREEHKGPGPAAVRIRSESLFNPASVEAFVRICTREGLLVPASRAQHGLDGPVDTYEISPLLIAPRDPISVTQFDDAIVKFEVHATDIEQWTKPGGRRNVRQLKRVFVSFWMSDPRTPGQLPELVRKGLLRKAEVITGTGLHGSPQWSPEIRSLIKGADVVVLDLTVPRREVFVEWGWAIGAQKPVILCAKNRDGRCRNPRWVQERQVKLYETEAELAELVSSILHCLDLPQDRVNRWIDDPAGKSMNYRPRAKTVGMVGRSAMFPRLESLCEGACQENGFEFIGCLEAEPQEGGRLFGVISLARKAGTLVLLFDGTEDGDLLSCVAGGVFTTQDDISMGNKKVCRKLMSIAPPALSNQILPGLLRKPGAFAERNADNVSSALRTHLVYLNQKINDARTGTRNRHRPS